MPRDAGDIPYNATTAVWHPILPPMVARKSPTGKKLSPLRRRVRGIIVGCPSAGVNFSLRVVLGDDAGTEKKIEIYQNVEPGAGASFEFGQQGEMLLLELEGDNIELSASSTGWTYYVAWEDR